MIIFRLIWESLVMSFQTFAGNRLRTALSLLGITIGIFAIIAVFTIVDSLELNIRESVSSLGDNVVYVEKWPWAPEEGEEYAWWKYMNRPIPSVKEKDFIKRNSIMAEESCFVSFSNRTVKYKNNLSENTTIIGASDGFQNIRSFEIEQGRYFSPLEVAGGRNIAVIGIDLADELFEGLDPIDKVIKVAGFKVNVIGVTKREGKSTFGDNSLDELVIMPINFMKSFVDIRREQNNPQIWVKAKKNATVADLTDELRHLMRSYRRVKPGDDDNFALNQTSLINNQLDQVFKVINAAGFFIGIFSILVGGFGIANIMFVSVKERTHIIGIQKAIGAKNYFVMMEFLFESVLLSVAGGVVGLIMVAAGTLLINLTGDFKMYLTASNIILGISISSIIGVVSGFAPAWQAAKMDPVTAMNSTF